nr:RNA-directed DNA polymerase, eukaryota [Tanacetum cinerariifolium]
MGDEHLNTIPAIESNELIKSSVENLVPNPSESEGEKGCDMPACFTTFSNVLFDAEYEFDSVDDQSLSNEDFPEEIFSNPLFEEEIISTKMDPHHFDVESDLIESTLNRDSSITPSSSKIDSLLNEIADELTLLKSIPPGIDKTDCYPEEDIRFTKRLLYDNSSPQIDLTFTPDDPMPPGIEEDDDDSERDILILEEFPSNYSLSLPEDESFHFDILLFSRPPAKPPDGNTGILNIKMMGDVSAQKTLYISMPVPTKKPATSPPPLQHPDTTTPHPFNFYHPSPPLPPWQSQEILLVSRKRILWDYVSTLIDHWNGEVVVLGDFNEVWNIDERRGSCFNPTSARVFDLFISASGLVDVKMEGYTFTWSHLSGSKMSKLDRFLVSECIFFIFPSITAVCLDRHLSDHRLIILCEDLKVRIRAWIKDKRSSVSGEKDSIKKELSDIDRLLDGGDVSDSNLLRRSELHRNLYTIDQMESKEYLQKSKIKWAIEGDENSNFFMV